MLISFRHFFYFFFAEGLACSSLIFCFCHQVKNKLKTKKQCAANALGRKKINKNDGNTTGGAMRGLVRFQQRHKPCVRRGGCSGGVGCSILAGILFVFRMRILISPQMLLRKDYFPKHSY